MKLERLLSTLTGAERFPCELVLFNLADTKRRNSHLGFAAVDGDIAAFDAIVSKLTIAPRGDRSARVSGDQWLFLGTDGRSFALAALAAYSLTEPYGAGWRCRATKDGVVKEVVEVVTTTLTRSARIALAVVSSREEIELLASRLDDQVWQAEVGTISRLEDLVPPKTDRWKCVASYPTRAYYCPFCEVGDFAWTDGDGAVYSGDATCKSCHAELSFHDAGGVVRPSACGT